MNVSEVMSEAEEENAPWAKLPSSGSSMHASKHSFRFNITFESQVAVEQLKALDRLTHRGLCVLSIRVCPT